MKKSADPQKEYLGSDGAKLSNRNIFGQALVKILSAMDPAVKLALERHVAACCKKAKKCNRSMFEDVVGRLKMDLRQDATVLSPRALESLAKIDDSLQQIKALNGGDFQ